ncbi:papain-like cysteine protease family protein [Collimonas fungivorans]|uniref:papain-like cysteine protease family protein n=1 Tax=Collimonas fungivorans TaxID=158899 RepID=UPI0026B5EC14
MKIGQNTAYEAQISDRSEAGGVSQQPKQKFTQPEKSRPGALSAPPPLGTRLTRNSLPTQPPRLNVISRHGSAAERGAPAFSGTPSFGGGGQKSSSSKASSSSRYAALMQSKPPLFLLRNVPYVSQGSEQMGCWYACARMIGHSAEAGPRLGLPQRYSSDAGHQALKEPADIEQFISNEGLSRVNLPDSQAFSLEELVSLLEQHGPILFAWHPNQNSGHMSVLIGVDKKTSSVVYHDPQKGPDRGMPLSHFNQHLAWEVPYAMMHR